MAAGAPRPPRHVPPPEDCGGEHEATARRLQGVLTWSCVIPRACDVQGRPASLCFTLPIRAARYGGGITRRSEFRVLVTGLPKTASWQDLKDHMRKAGDVTFAQARPAG